MKRKAIYISLSYMAGLFFASIVGNPYGITLILSVLFIFFIVCRAMQKNFCEILIMLISSIIAFGIYSFYNTYVYETLLECDNTDGYFSGKITDIEDYGNDTSRYTLDGTINNTIDAKIICYDLSYNCKIGDTMSFDCDFSKFDSDYLFDSKSYYKGKNIFLQAENIENVQIESYNKFLFENVLYNYRDKIISDFKIKMSIETGTFLSAMVFGDKSSMEDSTKTYLYRSGIGHIMAISGIHVAIASMFLMFVMRKLHFNKIISFAILTIFLILMTITVKSPLSVIRASIMIIILYSAKIFRRENDTFNSLAIAILIICISNPFVIHNQGFLLSASGTYGIGVFAPYMTKNINSKFIKNLMSMFYVSVCVIPLSLNYFDEVSIISPFSNIFIIPLCSISLVIGLIYVLSGGFIDLLFIAKIFINAVLNITNLIGESSFVYVSGNSDIFIISVCLFVMGAVFRKRKLINIIISFGCLFLFGYNYIHSQIEKDIFKIAFLGRNQNTAVVITYNNHTDIIDLSGHYKDSDYVSKYLSQNKITKINNLLLTQNQPSSIVTYQSSLFDIENILVSNETSVSHNNNNLIFYHENEVKIEYIDCCFRYSENILYIDFDGYSVCVSPYEYNGDCIADIFIFYGNFKNIDMPRNYTICTAEYNNFCLEISNNSFKIRSV